MSKRAAIYIRTSSEKQAEKVSPEAQEADCRAYCKERGYEVVAVYRDIERYRVKSRLVEPSGTRSDRPGYKALIQGAYDGKFDVVVGWKEDRLCRGIYSATPLQMMMDETKVTVELVKEHFDPSMFSFKAAIGKMEIDNIKQRVHMGVQGRLEKGIGLEIHRRYGYQFDDNNQFVKDESRAGWVAQIYKWYLERVNAIEIRRRLLEGEAPKPDRKSGPSKPRMQWPMATLHRILTSPEYYQGYIEAHRDGKTYRIPCPPIITKAMFDKVQALRKENQSHAESLVKQQFLCMRLVTCADKLTWRAHTIRWRSKRVLRKNPIGRYTCPGQTRHPDVYKDADCPKAIGSKKLDTFVWSQLVALFDNPAIVKKGIHAQIEKLRQSERETQQEFERLGRDLEQLTVERQWVISQARKGNISESDMEYQLQEITQQEAALTKEREENSASQMYREKAQDLANFAEAYLTDVRAGLQWLNQDICTVDDKTKQAIFEERRRVVKLLVARIVVHKDQPPEVVFAIDVDKAVLGASTESNSRCANSRV